MNRIEEGLESLHSLTHSLTHLCKLPLLRADFYAGHHSLFELWNMTDVHAIPGHCALGPFGNNDSGWPYPGAFPWMAH